METTKHFKEIEEYTKLPDYINDANKDKYDSLFLVADVNKDGFVDGEEARIFFSHSKLPSEKLSQIWKLSDTDFDGKLNKKEFRLAMHLVYSCLSGCELPSMIVESLLISAELDIGKVPETISKYGSWTPDVFKRIQQQNQDHTNSLLNTNLKKKSLSSFPEEDARHQAASSLKKAYYYLEKGNFTHSLHYVEEALNFLANFSSTLRHEFCVCTDYKSALNLLIRIQECDAVENFVYSAIFSRFLAEISIQPKHRIICIRLALNKNLKIRNYGIAARFIRELLPLHPIDETSLQSKLRLCNENSFSNQSLLEYKCPICNTTVSCAPLNCTTCNSPIQASYFIEKWKQISSTNSQSKTPSITQSLSHLPSHTPPKLQVSPNLSHSDLTSESPNFSSQSPNNFQFLSPHDSPDNKVKSPTLADALNEVDAGFGNIHTSFNISNPSSKRDIIVNELLQSERTYVRALDVLVNIYYKPLEKMVDKIITKQQIKSIFSNIQVIHNYNSWFLTQLEARINEWSSTQKLGDLILELVDYFKLYTAFVNSYGLAIVTISDLKDKSHEFSRFLEENKTRCENLDIHSYLICPIQRLPRYVLLLEDLVKHTPETHVDYSTLKSASEKMKQVADYVNEKKRDAENMNSVFAVQEKLIFPPGISQEPLMQPHRRFIREGILTIYKPNEQKKEHFCFLFNDLFIAATHENFRTRSGSISSPESHSVKEEGLFRVRRYILLRFCHVEWTKNFDTLQLSTNKEDFLISLSNRQELEDWFNDILSNSRALIEKEKMRTLHSKNPDLLNSQEEELNDTDWKLIFTNGSVETFSQNQVIIPIGEANSKFYRIIEGEIHQEFDTPTKKSKTLLKLGPRAIFGMESFTSIELFSTRFVCSSSTAQLSVIEATFVIRLLRVEPNIASKFYRLLATTYAHYLRQIESGKDNDVPPITSSSVLKKEYSEFEARFPWHKDEVPLRSYEVNYRRSLSHDGTLYITQTNLLFYCGLFGLTKVVSIPLEFILTIVKKESDKIVITKKKATNTVPTTSFITFKDSLKCDEAYDLISSVLKNIKVIHEEKKGSSTVPDLKTKSLIHDSSFALDTDLPTKEDWQLILEGAQRISYKAGSVISKEGEYFQRIYQILIGTCRVEKIINGKTEELAKLHNGDIFGELSFLEKTRASASVLADTDVEIVVIEGYSLGALFEVKSGLGGRFFKYLSSVIQKRYTRRILQLIEKEK